VEIFLITAWSLVITVTVLLLMGRINKKYRIPFVQNFFIYLTAYYGVGFALMWSVKTVLLIFSNNQNLVTTVEAFLFILGLPLMGLLLFLFIKFVTALLQEELSTAFIISYWTLWGILTASFIIGAWVLYSPTPYSFFGYTFPQACGWSYKGTLYLVMGYLLIKAWKSPDPVFRKQTMILGLLILIPTAVHHFNNYIIQNVTLTAMFFFAVPLPAVLYLSRYLKILVGKNPDIDSLQLAQLMAKFEISRREEEIIRLILAGKSNKDIENELYISPHTVKNHLYRIYKKMGIGSRFHLINLFHKGR
jgi:DNA-binding CsgD family transcriptional regulator